MALRPESSRSGSELSNRPATAVRGAGYTSHSSSYDVLSQPSRNMIMSELNKEERYENYNLKCNTIFFYRKIN